MQVKERREPDRPGKGLFPWQMILFTAVLTIVGVCSLLLEKPDISEMEQRDLAKKPKISWQKYMSPMRQLEMCFRRSQKSLVFQRPLKS